VRLAAPLILLLAVGALEASDAVLEVAGGRIEVTIGGRALGDQTQVTAWIQRAAEAVGEYYDGFPVPRLRLAIAVDDGDGVEHGHEDDGERIEIELGADTTDDELRRDWRLTHEMVHLAFPDLDRRSLWMEEGLATYLEPIARCRVGQLPDEVVWRELVEGLPQGLPEAGDRGLERTPTWGRTYWGGALFWLLADLGIRERSGGQRSLRDVLRAIHDAGGTNGNHWDIARVLTIGDAAAGAPVLRPLYQRLALAPGTEDLDALWRRLGVVYRDGRVTFDDAAPDAALRGAITER
jgi:hypothetical protein